MDQSYIYGDAKATAKAPDAGRKLRSLSEAREAYDASPSIETALKLANCQFETGKFEDAEKVLGMLLADNKDDLRVLWNLGFVYKNLEKRDAAISAFQRVIRLSPKHELARSAELQMWEMDPQFKPSWMRK